MSTKKSPVAANAHRMRISPRRQAQLNMISVPTFIHSRPAIGASTG